MTMELNLYLKKFQKTKSPVKIFSAEQALAEEIWNFFYKKLPFPRIMRIIKTHGRQKVYEIFNNIRQSGPKNPVALFVWKFKKGNS